MKKRVIKFFSYLFLITIMLGVIHYMRFGGFTGYAVLKNLRYDVEEINFEKSAVVYWFVVFITAYVIFSFVYWFLVEHYRAINEKKKLKFGGERRFIDIKIE